MNETNPIATCPKCGKQYLSSGMCKTCYGEAIDNTAYPGPPLPVPWVRPEMPWKEMGREWPRLEWM